MMTTTTRTNDRGWKMETVEWSEKERESEKAILVGIRRSGLGFSGVWVPKSVIENWTEKEGSAKGTLDLPVWWLIKNGF